MSASARSAISPRAAWPSRKAGPPSTSSICASGRSRIFAGGLRNPVGLAWEPQTGVLWTVVNERDGLGDETPPDYLTSVRDGGFYGWPYCYWGQTVDDRVPQDPAAVAKAITPDYALGGHTASLGLCWLPAGTLPGFPDGMAIGQHGSWNRSTLSGYKVVFVPFANGRPAGPPRDILTGFLAPDERVSYGRPVGVDDRPRRLRAGGGRCGRCDLARDRRAAGRVEDAKKAPDKSGALSISECRQLYSASPIATFSVPTPSTPHSILSPGRSCETPAGVPVMMMSPAASFTCCESCQMISGTLQINSVRSPFWVSLPLTVERQGERRDVPGDAPWGDGRKRHTGAAPSNPLERSQGSPFFLASLWRSRSVRSRPTA